MATAVIVAPNIDVHAFAVSRECNNIGADVWVLDPQSYGEDFALSTSLVGDSSRHFIERRRGSNIDLRDVSGLWWRRPFESELRYASLPTINKAVRREVHQALIGGLRLGVRHQFNDLSASRRASEKLRQLTIAQQYSFCIPPTLVTNDEKTARHWIASQEPAIFKMFHGSKFGLFETRRMTEEHLNDLWRIKKCPILLQKFVLGVYDLRVTVVRDQVFAARIDYESDSEIIDSRITQTDASPYVLPTQLRDALLKYVKQLGLDYAAIDMRRSTSGEYVFFEINPDGQYLWTEIEAELPISLAIANMLINSSQN